MFPLFPLLPFSIILGFHLFTKVVVVFRVQQITDTIVGRLLELTRALFKIRPSTDFLLFQLTFASQ